MTVVLRLRPLSIKTKFKKLVKIWTASEYFGLSVVLKFSAEKFHTRQTAVVTGKVPLRSARHCKTAKIRQWEMWVENLCRKPAVWYSRRVWLTLAGPPVRKRSSLSYNQIVLKQARIHQRESRLQRKNQKNQSQYIQENKIAVG